MKLFLIWSIFGCLMIISGIRALVIKRAFNFFPEIKIDIKNYKKFNIIIGIFFIIIGILTILSGLPFILNKSLIIPVTITLTIVLFIALFIGYLLILHIFEKYEKKMKNFVDNERKF